jgi:hypothetical protein
VTTLVVGGDGNVDVLGGGVGVAEGNDGDVDVAGLLDSLGVGARVGDDNQAGLLERAGDVVGEATGGEASSDGGSAGVGGELEDGTLTVGTGRDDTDVGGVLDGDDDTGSEDNLLPLSFQSHVSSVLMYEFSFWSSPPPPAHLPPKKTHQVLPTFRTLTPSTRVFHR